MNTSFEVRPVYSLALLLPSVWIPPTVPSDLPRAADERLTVELVAREPDIVTPTGIAVDERGRVWVIENHTHQRPADYAGPAGDRIRILDDFAADGRAGRVRTFADGFQNGMGLGFGPGGKLFFATRSEIMLLGDRDGDDRVDDKRVLVRLETEGTYPHNGLCGFAFDALDNVYFGLGENLGEPYKLVGSDGTRLSGGGEGGNIYRCRPDGSKLTRVATGFWNPFHMTFDGLGRLFAVDNDPDSRPPCRLLHIIPGGDYGYRFRNGRKGLHPFTAWNGELPGTLPMVAGTGEAPSGMVAYESDGLPADYFGELLVTSWGDHMIQRFRLADRGASFSSRADTLVRGPDDFYPVGIAIAPDGSLVVSDWADKSYPLHGKGRVWRVRMKERPVQAMRPSAVAGLDDQAARALLDHPNRALRQAAADALVQRNRDGKWLEQLLQVDATPRAKLHVLWAAAKSDPQRLRRAAALTAKDPSAAVRAERVALLGHLAADEIARESGELAHPAVTLQFLLSAQHPVQVQREAIEALKSSDPFVVSAAIGAIARAGSAELVLDLLQSSDTRIRLHAAIAARTSPRLNPAEVLPQLLNDPDSDVRRVAMQWIGEDRLTDFESDLARSAATVPVTRELFEAFLAAREFLDGVARKPSDEPSGEDFVLKIVRDDKQPDSLRALALQSLRPDHPGLFDHLKRLAATNDPALRRETIRTLSARTDQASQSLLRDVAADEGSSIELRAQALLGLAHSAGGSDETRRLLVRLLDSSSEELRIEAIRALRGAAGDASVSSAVARRAAVLGAAATDREAEQIRLFERRRDGRVPPTSAGALEQQIEQLRAGAPGDAAAGERAFFHPNGPKCFACHRVNGRGGVAGPDLSAIGRTQDRDKILRSILSPSSDVAPQFASWTLALRNGQTYTGMLVREDPRGSVTLADSEGKLHEFSEADIELRRASDRSIMPDNLADQMTRSELLDLAAFLESLK